MRKLTERQRQVLALAAEGKTNEEIAAALRLSKDTISPIFAGIYSKMGIRQARQEAIARFLSEERRYATA